MTAALQRQRIPGNGTAASSQEQGGEDLARMAEDEGGRPLADARLARRLGGALLRRPCGSLPAHDGRQIEIVIGMIDKSFTQGSRFRLRRMMSFWSAQPTRQDGKAPIPVVLMAKPDRAGLNET
jgi:hypothetical protein